MLDTLIIRGELVNPPTELQAFRTLTLMANNMRLHSILEIDEFAKDIYWHYLKEKRVHDFIEQLVTPKEKEFGIRLDFQVVDRITFCNLVRLLGWLKGYKVY